MREISRRYITLEELDSDEDIVNEETGEAVQDEATELSRAETARKEEEADADIDSDSTRAVRNTRDLTNFARVRRDSHPLTEAEIILFKNNVANELSRARVPDEAIRETVVRPSIESYQSDLILSLEAATKSIKKFQTTVNEVIKVKKSLGTNTLTALWSNIVNLRKSAQQLRKLSEGVNPKVIKGKEFLPAGSADILLADTKTLNFITKGIVQRFSKEVIRSAEKLSFPITYIQSTTKQLDKIFIVLDGGKKDTVGLAQSLLKANEPLSTYAGVTENSRDKKRVRKPLSFGNQAIAVSYKEADTLEEILFSLEVSLTKFHPRSTVMNPESKQPVLTLDEIRIIPNQIDDLASRLETYVDKSARKAWNDVDALSAKLINRYEQHEDVNALNNSKRILYLCIREILLANAIALEYIKTGRALINLGKRSLKAYPKR